MPNATAGLPNPQSFDAADEIVIDRVTGLAWQRRLDGQLLTHEQAQSHCEELTLAGYSDWRLPSRIELISILDSTRVEPSINVVAFPETPNDWFWTASVAADDPASAWYVYFYFGYPRTDGITNRFSVRCVRTNMAHTAPVERYGIAADIVSDVATGLRWQRTVDGGAFSFAEAADYCAKLALAGHHGWRLPSMVELLTLVDERARAAPRIDPSAFPDTPSEAFWTSTGFGGSDGMAWQVYFQNGSGLYGLPDARFRVRCVM